MKRDVPPAVLPTPAHPVAHLAPEAPVQRLLNHPQAFAFHQAVRILERWLAHPDDRADRLPAELRFRNSLSLSFPASEIHALQTHGPDPDHPERIEITPAFMGLLGVTGTLPLAYTEQVQARELHARDGAARAFFDIFQHRALSLFHAAWRKHRLPLQHEVAPAAAFRPRLLALAGLGLPGLANRLRPSQGAVSDDALAFYAGALQQRVISAPQLQRLLADYFGVPVQLQSFAGRWFPVEAANQSRLGLGAVTLGRDALVGERLWQRDLRARLTLGPLSRTQQARFLPGGPGALALKELLTLATGLQLEYEVHLCLRARDVQPACLGGDPDTPPQLGWNTYLLSQASPVNRTEAAYDIHAA